jgi:hypothetical protein
MSLMNCKHKIYYAPDINIIEKLYNWEITIASCREVNNNHVETWKGYTLSQIQYIVGGYSFSYDCSVITYKQIK